jgi:hypothetical protein
LDESPTVQALRGNPPEQGYFKSIEALNIEKNRQDSFEINKDETRVMNLKTGKFEYKPKDFEHKRWNTEAERWEYHPDSIQPKDSQ